MLGLNARQLGVVMDRCVLRPPQQYQLKRFKVHRLIVAPRPVAPGQPGPLSLAAALARGSDGGPRRSHHGPFGKGKNSPLNPAPSKGRDPKYGQARLEVARWHTGSRWTGAWLVRAGPAGVAGWEPHGSADSR